MNKKKSVMNRREYEAQIWFDNTNFSFVGEIQSETGLQKFYGRSVKKLANGYNKAVNQIMEKEKIREELIREISNHKELLQSGEARIKVDIDQSPQRIGMKIKQALLFADGATVTVQEKRKNLNIGEINND